MSEETVGGVEGFGQAFGSRLQHTANQDKGLGFSKFRVDRPFLG